MNSPFVQRDSRTGNTGNIPFDIFKLLKERTAELHRDVESRVPVFRDDFSRDKYARLVERFFGFWAPLEVSLWALQELRDSKLALKSRLKSSLLREDLSVLGRDPDSLPLCDRLPLVDTFLTGLGCLYVLEGSTLGSRFISQRIEVHLQLRQSSGASFFNAYGDSVGLRWTEFKKFVTENVSEKHAEELVAAAQQTFHCLHDWLGPSFAGSGTNHR